jgi:hypothetical protein
VISWFLAKFIFFKCNLYRYAAELREMARTLTGYAEAGESQSDSPSPPQSEEGADADAEEGAVLSVLSHLALASSVTRELIRHTVGLLYKMNAVDPAFESAWFQPLNL